MNRADASTLDGSVPAKLLISDRIAHVVEIE